MDEEEFESFLAEAIQDAANDSSNYIPHDVPLEVGTFEDRGVLTMNRGLVVRVGRQEFQVTIVRSR